MIDTLYLLFPGEYVLGALIFLLSLFVLKLDTVYIQRKKGLLEQIAQQ